MCFQYLSFLVPGLRRCGGAFSWKQVWPINYSCESPIHHSYKALPYMCANPFSLGTLQDLFSEDSWSHLDLFHGPDRLSNNCFEQKNYWPCCSYSCQVWTFWYSQDVLRSLIRKSAHLYRTCSGGILWNHGRSSLTGWAQWRFSAVLYEVGSFSFTDSISWH